MAPIKSKAFINVDLGEAYGNFKCGPDDELFPLIDQANVACGFQYVKRFVIRLHFNEEHRNTLGSLTDHCIVLGMPSRRI